MFSLVNCGEDALEGDFLTIFGAHSDPSQHRANPYGAGLGSF